MTDELLKELQPLVASETERASKQYGEKYASAHEAESVLREEVEEMFNEATDVNFKLGWIAVDIHKHNIDDMQKGCEDIKQKALNAAAEAIQVAAVCEKIARGFQK